ncbi:MAG: B12-binding domain-containing radical SAM protein [Desulfobacteraceae bacterium]|nr:B12-binding domain-containing radical SAM protein [Desulfobacteraceae bacterium]
MTQNKILLIHPLGYPEDRAGEDISRKANIMPPLGLASIAAYLEQFEIQADIIDCYAHPFSDDLITAYITKEAPSFVGFSCTTATFLDGVRIAGQIKKIRTEIQIVFGGVHVSALKNKIIDRYPVIDYVVVGEGEHTLHRLLTAAPNEKAGIKNLVLRSESGKAVFTGFRKKQIDLDTLPFPAYEKLFGFPNAYKLPIFNYPSVPNASCISSRGCPYACSYCDRSVFRRTFRYNSARYLYHHLKYLNDEYGIRHINFYDDQFTFNRKRVEQFAGLMIEKPLRMTFNCAARAEHLDAPLLDLMKKAGCLEMIARKVELIKEAGIRVKGLLMLGLPGETRQSIQKSKTYVNSLKLDDFNLAKFTPFPGSPIYDQIQKKGPVMGNFDENWEKMDCMQFVFVPKGMTKSEMDEEFITFYKTHFMKPKVWLNYVSMLWKSPDSWKRFLKDMFGFLRFAFADKRR